MPSTRPPTWPLGSSLDRLRYRCATPQISPPIRGQSANVLPFDVDDQFPDEAQMSRTRCTCILAFDHPARCISLAVWPSPFIPSALASPLFLRTLLAQLVVLILSGTLPRNLRPATPIPVHFLGTGRSMRPCSATGYRMATSPPISLRVCPPVSFQSASLTIG